MKKRFIPLAISLVITMFLIVGFTDSKEILFPEIAALAVGAWVMERSPWETTVFKLWFSPTLAALTGVLILKIFPYSPFLMIAGAFILVVAQLKVTRSNVLPSISAAILPIIMQANSWVYPLSVAVFTGLIAVGRVMIGALTKKPSPTVPEIGSHELSGELFYWIKLFFGVMVVTAVALWFNILYMIVPPLIVMFVELSNPNSPLRGRLGGVLLVIAFAALSGVLSLHYLHYVLHYPIWFSSGFALAGLFIVYIVLKLPFPPAAAVCLLPTLLPEGHLWTYIWQVILGAVGFMAIDLLWFKVEKTPVSTKVGLGQKEHQRRM